MPSENTVLQYQARIKTLSLAKIDAIADPDSLFAWFAKNQLGTSSQKSYLSAIKYASKDSIFPEVLQEKLTSNYKKQNDTDKQQKLTKAQALHYLDWNDILAVQKKLADMLNKTESQQKHLLVVSLYTLTPPVRADYGDVEIFKNKAPKLRPRTGNELIWTKNPVFIFREYKTAKTYGEVVLPIPKSLVTVIENYFTFLGKVPQFLLGEKTSANTLSTYIQSIFKQYTGKETGVSLLRHSFITFIFPTLTTILKKESLARQMLHSRQLQETYVSAAHI